MSTISRFNLKQDLRTVLLHDGTSIFGSCAWSHFLIPSHFLNLTFDDKFEAFSYIISRPVSRH